MPAPILFASVSEVQVVAPAQLANEKVTNIQVEYNGLSSPAWGVPVLASDRKSR